MGTCVRFESRRRQKHRHNSQTEAIIAGVLRSRHGYRRQQGILRNVLDGNNLGYQGQASVSFVHSGARYRDKPALASDTTDGRTGQLPMKFLHD